ncbi:MAG: hypothetical protein JXR76_16300 [Deltaproteobacteria bacterium]|nr:hypothetical protein [Deltaproteobacteria bacterium]
MRIKLIFAIILLSMLSIACEDVSSSDDGNEMDGTAEKDGSVVAASASSQKLGVSSWKISPMLIAQGLDANNAVVAEFKLDAENRTVESVFPAAGIRNLDEPGVNDTIPADAAALLDSMIDDLESLAGDAIAPDISGEVVNKAVFGCYQIYNDCDIVGFILVWKYGYTGYVCRRPTNTCGNYWALLV